jgi:RHS repeat-associated protein
VYASQARAAVSRTVTDPVGNQETWVFQENLGEHKLVSRMSLVDNKGITNQYDANNNLISATDEEGRLTTYTYNATNQRTSMTEGAGTTDARTTTYTYVSADIDLTASVTTSSVYTGLFKITSTSYDADLNPIAVSISGFDADGSPVSRTSSFSYNAIGQIIQIDGPRTDVIDTTDFTYYDCNTGAECGQLASITNAIGHTTTFDSYDRAGNLLRSTDANGNITTYTYDSRQRVISITVSPTTGSPRSTSYAYDYTGQLVQIDFPDGIQIINTYNEAHYLTSVEDNLGNRIEYDYDLKGNRIQSATRGSLGDLQRIVDTAFDHRDYAVQFNNAGSITAITRDAVGNTSTEVDPNNNQSRNLYDSLDRLNRFIDPMSGQTGYHYDIQDHITQVTAPNGVVTQYDYDDLGNLLVETSADRGRTTYFHDSAGNVISTLDARGVTVFYTYDALNRPTSIDYPGADEDISIAYDHCLNGAGRTCQISDQTGITDYVYDSFGNTINVSKLEMGYRYDTAYRYDEGDRVTEIIYPSSRVVTYIRDSIGRVTDIKSNYYGVTTDIVTNITYRADNLITNKIYGNGLAEILQYDQLGRLTDQQLGDTYFSYSYDANSNLLGLNKDIESRSYEYDQLDRLISDVNLGNNDRIADYGYRYDSNGNRTEQIIDTDSTLYSYTAGSNQVTDTGSGLVTYDAAGNITSTENESHRYSYNQSGRLASYTLNGKLISNYSYNAAGQRTYKINHRSRKQKENIYIYDLKGNLIGENINGKSYRDYIWLDNQPVAQILYDKSLSDITQTTYISTDHLNTPRYGTNELQDIVWRWDSEGFGSFEPVVYGKGKNKGTEINLRFPGQYYDSESGLYYNWNRYYDPEMGRYITSDPIGLDGGINTYGYVKSNPMKLFDPNGLATIAAVGTIHFPGFIIQGLQYLFPLKNSSPYISGYHAGIAISFPTPWEPDVLFDIGLFGGTEFPVLDIGLGKASVDIGVNSGSLCDLEGGGYEVSAVISKYSGGISFSEEGELTGIKAGRGAAAGRAIAAIRNTINKIPDGGPKKLMMALVNNNLGVVYQKTGVISVRGQ